MAYYSVTKKGSTVIVRARDTDAKQLFFGWAGGGGAGMELYGRGTGRGYGDDEVWEWKLSPAGVDELLRGLSVVTRWTTPEKKRRAELLKKIEKHRAFGGKRRHAPKRKRHAKRTTRKSIGLIAAARAFKEAMKA